METLLALALIAGDPDVEWSSDAPAAPPLVAPAPTPPLVTAPPAPVADAQSAWATNVEQQALSSTFRVAAEVSVGISDSSMGQLGLGLELGWHPLQFVRLHANLGGAWVPVSNYAGVSNRGAVRLVGGVDGVLPFTWGELFIGIDSGVVLTNAGGYTPYCDFCGDYSGGAWQPQPAMRVRGGFDLTRTRPLIVGFDIGYELFAVTYREVHWAELHARVGFAF